jgi:ribosomal protein S27E
MTDEIHTVIPHSNFGTPECSGCLFARIGLDTAVIACDGCGKIVRRVAAGDLQRTLDEMELQLEVATALCRHCRAVNLFPGLSRVAAFVCQACGKRNT